MGLARRQRARPQHGGGEIRRRPGTGSIASPSSTAGGRTPAPNGRTIACHTDIKADPGLVTDLLVLDPKEKVVYARNNRKEMIGGKLNWTAPALLVCGDELKYCV